VDWCCVVLWFFKEPSLVGILKKKINIKEPPVLCIFRKIRSKELSILGISKPSENHQFSLNNHRFLQFFPIFSTFFFFWGPLKFLSGLVLGADTTKSLFSEWVLGQGFHKMGHILI
jgi:hypothetical protein